MTELITTLVVALAGGIGAALRLTVNSVIHRRARPSFPIALFIINVSGSFFLAFAGSLAASHIFTDAEGLYIGVGLVGGFTAFSTASFQTLRLLQLRRYGAALVNSVGMAVVAIAFAALGLWLGVIV